MLITYTVVGESFKKNRYIHNGLCYCAHMQTATECARLVTYPHVATPDNYSWNSEEVQCSRSINNFWWPGDSVGECEGILNFERSLASVISGKLKMHVGCRQVFQILRNRESHSGRSYKGEPWSNQLLGSLLRARRPYEGRRFRDGSMLYKRS